MDVMLWDKSETASVRASKIRSFTITPNYPSAHYGDVGWSVRGWYNEDNYFYFGTFETEEEARAYLKAIHDKIQGGRVL
jgi:hypothetical protein